MDCRNPDHDGEPDEVCAGCYIALDREHTALNDRYMLLLAENGELRRKLNEAERAGTVVPLPSSALRYTAGETGFESVDGVDALQVGPRGKKSGEDVLVLSVFHRTTGGGRSNLLTRAHAAALHAWLGWWLANGWPGVPRRCGLEHADRFGTWRCDQDPDHRRTDHEGPAIGWRAEGGKPARETWPWTPDERAAVSADRA